MFPFITFFVWELAVYAKSKLKGGKERRERKEEDDMQGEQGSIWNRCGAKGGNIAGKRRRRISFLSPLLSSSSSSLSLYS